MLAEFGQMLLVLAVILAAFGGLPRRAQVRLLPEMAEDGWSVLSGLQLATVAGAMATLIALFVDSDFTVALVAAHSHSQKPLLFKIAGAWAQHEGSMLLWALVLVAYGAAWGMRHPKHALTPDALRTQSLLLLGTLLFILFTSNPFARLPLPPSEGDGLNPLLQDVGLALHPPMLYLGYVGLSLIFSLAVAAMRGNAMGADWARIVRRWLIVPWAVLTVGIGLGSWWAYRELGWGGWWFWDPVENASFVPWLVATALMHSLVVLERRDRFHAWVALLATLGFGCSLMGTFLVRSGLLTSVHAFASDPTRGTYILCFLALMVGYALWEYGRFALTRPDVEPLPLALGRTHALLLNNLLLIVMAGTVLTGTLYPALLPLFSDAQISVGAPYFEATLYPLGAALLALGGTSLWLGWDATPLRRVRKAAMLQILLCLGMGGALAFLLPPLSFAAWSGVGFGGWMLIGALLPTPGGKRSFRRIGMRTAHAGLGLFVLCAAFNHGLKSEHAAFLELGKPATMGEASVTLMGLGSRPGVDYDARLASLRIVPQGKAAFTLIAEEQRYRTEGDQTNEAAIAYQWNGDWYAVAQFRDGGVQLKLMHEPAMVGLWLAVALMALGGLCSCLARLRSTISS